MRIICFWSRIFILPKMVVKEFEVVCINFRWGANNTYSRVLLVKWSAICTPKKEGGLGLKNLTAWNKALIAKHVWDVAVKKDDLWVWKSRRKIERQ